MLNRLTQDIHKVPFLRMVLALGCGISTAEFLDFKFSLVYWGGLLISFLLLFVAHTLSDTFRHRYSFAIPFFAFVFCVGALRSVQYDESRLLDTLPTKRSNYWAYISSKPIEKERSVFVELSVVNCEGHMFNEASKVWAYIEKEIDTKGLTLGDWVHFKAKLQVPQQNTLRTEFDYAHYLRNMKVGYIAYIKANDFLTLNIAPYNNMDLVILKVRHRVISTLKELGFEGEELALLSAVTVGYKKLIDKEQKLAFSNSGAMHIMAVSGLHVGILFVFAGFLFGRIRQIKYGKILYFTLILLTLWSFALLSGFSPSVVRASVMFTFILVGKTLNRQHYMVNTIAISAMVLLLYEPSLLFQPGFQLSFAAVLGIVVFHVPVSKYLLRFNPFWQYVLGLVSVTVVAQIVTSPFTIYFFHKIALLSVLSNLMVIPLIWLILNLTIPLVFLAFVGIHVNLLTDLLILLAKMLNGAVHLVGGLSFSSIGSLYFGTSRFLFLLAAFILLALYVHFANRKFLLAFISTLIVFVSIGTYQKIENLAQSELLVYAPSGKTQVLIKDKDVGCIITEMPCSQLTIPTWFATKGVSTDHITVCGPSETFTSSRVFLYKKFLCFDQQVYRLRTQNTQKGTGVFPAHASILFKPVYKVQQLPQFEGAVLYHGMYSPENERSGNYLNLNKIGNYNVLIRRHIDMSCSKY